MKAICFWNVRFIQTRFLLPEDFFIKFSNIVLLTRRVLSTYGIKDEGNFYNNLEFNGALDEMKNAKDFITKCETAHVRFLSESYLTFPTETNTSEVPEEIPITSYIDTAFSDIKIESPQKSELNPRYMALNTRPPTIKFLEKCSQEAKNKILKEWNAIEATETKSICKLNLKYII